MCLAGISSKDAEGWSWRCCPGAEEGFAKKRVADEGLWWILQGVWRRGIKKVKELVELLQVNARCVLGQKLGGWSDDTWRMEWTRVEESFCRGGRKKEGTGVEESFCRGWRKKKEWKSPGRNVSHSRTYILVSSRRWLSVVPTRTYLLAKSK